MSALMTLDRIGHAFAAVPVLSDISLEIAAGSYTVLLGPSGSGKTTLLSVLGGFLVPAQGRVLIEGEDVTTLPPARRPTATVFQDYALFPHMTVGANVGFGLRMRGVAVPERTRQARAVLALVGLEAMLDRKPHQLSGGQRQRVALARALVIAPKVLLLDEPLGALDLALRRQMQDELRATQRRVGTAFVHVTHDQEEAMALADTVVVMNAGRIEDAGLPERVYARPASRFTAMFMGESNLVEGRVTEARDGHVAVVTPFGAWRIAGSAAVGAMVAVAVRPECIVIGRGGDGAIGLGEARIGEVTFQGSFKRVRASVPDCASALLVRCPAGTPLGEGETVSLAVGPEDLVLLTR